MSDNHTNSCLHAFGGCKTGQTTLHRLYLHEIRAPDFDMMPLVLALRAGADPRYDQLAPFLGLALPRKVARSTCIHACMYPDDDTNITPQKSITPLAVASTTYLVFPIGLRPHALPPY